MKKAKELGKKNECKEYKKQMPKDKAAKIITKEIIFAQLKSKSKEDLLKLYRRLVIYFNPVLNTTGDINKQFTDLNKDELLTKLINLKRRLTNKEAASLLNISNDLTMEEKMATAEKGKIEFKEHLKKYRKEQRKEKKNQLFLT